MSTRARRNGVSSMISKLMARFDRRCLLNINTVNKHRVDAISMMDVLESRVLLGGDRVQA